jgi:crossover junction endodeoxyribonuclease RusA
VPTIRLPYPPSVNNYWASRVVARPGRKPFVHTFLGGAGKRFRVDVRAAVLERFGHLVRTRARVAVRLEVHPPDRRLRDLDNVLKAVLDALTHAGVWADDGQIDRLEVVRREPVGGGLVDVSIERLTPEPAAQKTIPLEAS